MQLFLSAFLLLLSGSQLTLALREPAIVDDDSSLESSEESKCPDNFYFSEVRHRCLECTECGTNLYEKEKCQPDQDTVCDWCLTRKPTMNEDYFRRCDDYKQQYNQLREELKAEINNERRAFDFPSKRLNWFLWLICVLATAAFIMVVFTVSCMFLARRRYTRVVNIQPPELSDVDQHNIIYAAKQIREKLAKRGGLNYEYL